MAYKIYVAEYVPENKINLIFRIQIIAESYGIEVTIPPLNLTDESRFKEIKESDLVLGIAMRKRKNKREWRRFLYELEIGMKLNKPIVVLTDVPLDIKYPNAKVVELPKDEREIHIKVNEVMNYIKRKSENKEFTEAVLTLLGIGFGLYVLPQLFKNN